MTTIVTRAGKGAPLTHTELDANFTNLNSGKVEKAADGSVAITANSTVPGLQITHTGTGVCLLVEDASSPDTSPFVIDANGGVVVGAVAGVGTRLGNAAVTPKVQVLGGTVSNASQLVARFANDTSQPSLQLAKSRGNLVTGIHAIVSASDVLGSLSFAGSDGSNFTEAARISGLATGTPGINVMPGSLVFSTNSGGTTVTDRMVIDSTGRVGINTASNPLSARVTIVEQAATSGTALLITNTGAGDCLVVEDASNPDATPFVINNIGQVIIGNTAALSTVYAGASVSPSLQSHGTSSVGASSMVARYSADAAPPIVSLAKSRGALGAHAALNSGDALGSLSFAGSDGTGFFESGRVSCTADGAHSTGSAPGRISLSTTASGSTSPTEAQRIDNAGAVFFPRIGTTASAANAYLNSGSSPANQLLRSTSSRRYKTNIRDLPAQYVSALDLLRPVVYRSNATADDQSLDWVGLIAEEVAEHIPRLVHYTTLEEGGPLVPDGVQYDRLAVLLLAEVKTLRARVAALEAA